VNNLSKENEQKAAENLICDSFSNRKT